MRQITHHFRAHALAAAIAIIAAVLLALPQPGVAAGAGPTQKLTWASYVNPRFGFTVYYPAGWFEPDKALPDDTGEIFESEKSNATIRVEGAFDGRRTGAEAFLKKQKEAGGYGDLSKTDMADFSYRVWGTRGEKRFFEKAVFSCKEQIINRLIYEYPAAEAEKYEAIIKKLDQRFSAGSGYDTPQNCV